MTSHFHGTTYQVFESHAGAQRFMSEAGRRLQRRGAWPKLYFQRKVVALTRI
jgi:hypothetical protein